MHTNTITLVCNAGTKKYHSRYKIVLALKRWQPYIKLGTKKYHPCKGLPSGVSGDPQSAEPILTDNPITIPVPEAGKKYFGLCRNSSYAAAERGDIPTIRIGRLLRVPVRALEAKLNRVSETA
jgi:hypothetical protein